MDKAVTVETKEPFAYLRLDDGGMNVLTPSIVEALESYIRLCVDDQSISVLIIEGNTHALTVGLDTEVVIKQDATADALLSRMRSVLEMLYLSRLRSIVIAEGHATAAGSMLLLVADHRLGIDSKGKIGLSEVRVGLPVPALTRQLVQDRIAVPAQYGTTALATLRNYPDALAIGFLDSLHRDRADALKIAHDKAEAFATLNEKAYLQTKLGMRHRFKEILEA